MSIVGNIIISVCLFACAEVNVALANERGGLDPILEGVADLRSNTTTLPKLNVHAFEYGKGKQTFEMIGEGSYVILGVVPAK
ncbi:MAG: hypothetical protein GY790_10950 [Bacteroidetes bacterium]|nr:hypothetical protein [Bacteroidota bacterium]